VNVLIPLVNVLISLVNVLISLVNVEEKDLGPNPSLRSLRVHPRAPPVGRTRPRAPARAQYGPIELIYRLYARPYLPYWAHRNP